MNFSSNEIVAAALIGFDMKDGPFLRHKTNFSKEALNINMDKFAVNFYLAFGGGNQNNKKPRAILYDDFYIVAFPKDLDLYCFFMKPKGIENNIKHLEKIAGLYAKKIEFQEKGGLDKKMEVLNENIEKIRETMAGLAKILAIYEKRKRITEFFL